MNKLLVVCGPTAVGKTALGIKLAKKDNGEIVSADSRQVYRYMNIGTGKDVGNVKFQSSNVKSISNNKLQTGYYKTDGIKLWLLDVVEPDYRFSVADYVKCANSVVKDIWKRGKLPILVGGTGFYIKGLVDGIGTLGVGPDWELRERLAGWPAGRLGKYLKKISPERWERMNESDRKNPRRLVRTIEIAQKIKDKKLKIKNRYQKLKIDKTLLLGLTAPNKTLYQRIDKRVDERVKEGVVKEIEWLLKKGYSWENSVLGKTIGYQEFQPFFESKETLAKVIQKWKYAEHAYSRRQKTWFKKTFPSRDTWFDLTQPGFEEKIKTKVENWFKT